MRILITGANGYIGSALREKLSHEIITLDFKDADINCNMSKQMPCVRVDIAIHLANSDVKGMLNFFKYVDAEKYIVASTSFSHFRRPFVTPYVLEKAFIEYVALNCDSTTILRQENVYGPSPKYKNNFVHINIKRALNNRPIEVHGYGHQVRNFIFIDDLIEFYKKAILLPPAGIVAVTGAEVSSLLDVAEKIRSCVDKATIKVSSQYTHTPIINEIYTATKPKKCLKYKSKVKLDEGIKRTVEWIRGGKNVK